MSVQVEKWVFTVDDYHRMAEAGILSEEDRVELIEGEITRMSPIGKLHAACVKRLNSLLSRRVGASVVISIQDPISLGDDSEPEPDIALLRPSADFYAQELPTAGDVLLIIEVADTSVEYDKNVKLPLYAKAGIPEVWLANIRDRTVELYSQPVNGRYQVVRTVKRCDPISPELLSSLVLTVNEILG